MLLIFNSNTVQKTKVILPPSWMTMEYIGSNMFVDKTMTKEQRQALLYRIPIAKKYVSEVWGEPLSQPVIYACSTEECFNRLGGQTKNHYFLKHLVLSPSSLTTEKISYEWSHIELIQRLDDSAAIKDIPRWFAEGIAVIVSHEPKYSKAIWQKISSAKLPHPTKEELKSVEDWKKAISQYQQKINTNEMDVTYATAGHIVRQWYQNAGKTGLLNIIAGIKAGKAFYPLYNNPALACQDIKELKNKLLADDM